MRRMWKISDAAQAELFLHRCSSAKHKTLEIPLFNTITRSSTRRFIREVFSQSQSCSPPFCNVFDLFADKLSYVDAFGQSDLPNKVLELRNELLENCGDRGNTARVLEERGVPLFRSYSDGSVMVELLKQLNAWPQLAFEVFYWRRNQANLSLPMTAEEYSKGITMAGRMKNVDLALELFTEASNRRIKNTSTYNALMGAYMFNGFAEKCQSLFRDLKTEPTCSPTIVTYNILISVFGRLMLIDHMEATLREINDLNLSPNVSTYNNLIAGYITAWMWDSMEKTYIVMKAGTVKPDLFTRLLMLRGYAHSGNLKKMEEMYESVKDRVIEKDISLIRAMICAYCRSSDENRVERVEVLLKLIPEMEYRPWLNVLLIRLYAQEDLVEEMECKINEAFEHNTSVTTMGVMRCIISSYFRKNAVDSLARFVSRAESAGWKLCRSLYHCKMVMYGSQNRLSEMEGVLHELDTMNLALTKKTFAIMYHAYSQCGQRNKLQKLFGVMCKYGYQIPLDTAPS